MVRGVLAGLITGVILTISPPLARAEADACAWPGDELAALQLTEPPVPVPEQTVLDGEGTDVGLADFRGFGIVLNFWATWCPPCIREMPALDALSTEVAGDRIKVLTVSEDRGGAKVVKAYLEHEDLAHLPVLIDPSRRLMVALKADGLPTTVLIDADGREVARLAGVAPWDDPRVVAFLRGCLGGGQATTTGR